MTQHNSNLDEANNAAAQQLKDDIDSLIATCPLMQDKIQLIPLRYALCEASEMLPSRVNGSLYSADGVMLGMRPMNAGYIYAIHSVEKNTLYCYGVSEAGALTGSMITSESADYVAADNDMIFPREGTLSTLFSPIALTVERAKILIGATSDQKALMTQINLAQLNPLDGNKGFAPANMLAKAVDFSGVLTPPVVDADIGAYQWLIDLNWKPQLLPSLSSMIKPEFRHDYGILLMNDICGDIVEVAEKSNNLLTQYQKAVEVKDASGNNQIDRHEVGELVRTLMSESMGYNKAVDSVISILGKPPKVDDEKDSFAKNIEDLTNAITEPENTVIEVIERTRHGSYHGGVNITRSNPKAEKLAAELGALYQVDGDELLSVVEQAYNDHKELTEGGLFGKYGMKDVIREDEMDAFFAEWDNREETFIKHLQPLHEFMKKLTPKWHLLAAYHSPQVGDNYAQKLVYEDIVCSFFKGNDIDWLREYYCGDDDFPLMVYSDVAANMSGSLTKDVISITASFTSLEEKLAAGSNWQTKINAANEVSLLGAINGDLKDRAIESLAKKNDMLVVALSMNKPGSAHNFSERLNQSYSNMSLGLKTQIKLGLEANSLHWNIPDKAALGKVDTLSEALSGKIEKDRALRARRKEIKNSYGRIKNHPSKSDRKRLRDDYNKKLAQSKKAIDANVEGIERARKELFNHTMDKGSLIGGHSVVDLNNAILQEARYLAKKPSEILKELTQSNNKFDKQKIRHLGASLMLTGLHFYHFHQAITTYLDEEQDGDLMNVITTGAYSLAGGVTLAGSVYNAKLNLAFATAGAETAATAALVKTAKWAVYSSPFTAWLGVWGMGVATAGTWQDYNKAKSQDDAAQKKLSLVRLVVSGVSLGAAAGEALAYSVYAVRLWLGGNVMLINEAVIRLASRMIRWHIGLFLAFYAADKLYQYYKWPKLVDWANDSLWGKSSKGWSVEEHYHQLDQHNGGAALHTEVLNNIYTEKDAGCPVVQCQLLLPGITFPHAENLSLMFTGHNLRTNQWHDLLPDMFMTANVESLQQNNCLLSLQLDADRLSELGFIKSYLSVKLTTEHPEGPQSRSYHWQINCNKDSFSPTDTPYVIAVRQWKIDNNQASALFTPWPQRLHDTLSEE
ncbi:hypothetical protein J8L86_20820 [Shewanella sp. MMG014]|uniref:toxin VasX n=1 Tax=Shewanella sp. MMG014 TaxID=2822691 RepID=UPI001B380F85|nr:toxin VasX [Shewanella sp. MMG014]MBQ4892297.1 hypothetical protein [Shewanella sp. MMG014]